MTYSTPHLPVYLALVCAAAISPTASAAPAPAPSAVQGVLGADAGRELQDAQQRMEAERVRQEMQAQQNAQGGTIEQETPDEQKPAVETRFVLQSVTVDASELLPDDVVQASYADFIGKEVSIDDLYAIVAKLNDWYAAHSYLTCRAYLPPQTIHAGAVSIAILEGKNGDVTVTGNRTTRANYIKDRMAVESGAIEDMSELQRRLDWFNGTNDVRLHITLQAGTAPGTTDYVIRAQEPSRRDTWTLYADHAGSETTGRWRQGLFYTNRSLSGRRDLLTLSYLHAEGLETASVGYEFPIGRRGARLAFDYSTNSTEVVDGFYKTWDIPVKGRASYAGVTYTQPLAVSYRGKTEASLALSQSKSRTDVMEEPLIDDTFRDVTAALTRTNYGNRWAFYRKYAFTRGSWDSDSAYQFRPATTYNIFDITGIYQRGTAHGQLLTLRTRAQWSLTDDLRPSKQFFLGGVTSVRGYPENEIGADNGITLSIEYGMPVFHGASLYAFLDAGKIWGGEVSQQLMENTMLIGTGLGLRTPLWKDASLDAAVGIPLKKTAGRDEVSSAQLHLSFVASF